MGIKERRQREKNNLKVEILEAARELFVREGYENVSMRKIADKIEYSPTTIYLYFKDKSELLYSLCEETFTKLLKRFEELKEETNGDNPLNCLKRGLRAYIEFGLRYPNHYKVTFIIHPEHHELPEHVRKEDTMGQQAFNHMCNLVAECVHQKKFRKVDIAATSQILWAACHGLVSLLIIHPHFPWADRNLLIDQMVDTITDSLLENS